MTAPTYSEQLKHPLWQRKRLHILERAGWACQACGATDSQLHAHHKVYLKGHWPWDYSDDLLECLCDPCHEKAHQHLKAIEITVAQQPSVLLPHITTMVQKLSAAMSATDRSQRVDALNALQDELDAIEDFRRGPGVIDLTPYIAEAQQA